MKTEFGTPPGKHSEAQNGGRRRGNHPFFKNLLDAVERVIKRVYRERERNFLVLRECNPIPIGNDKTWDSYTMPPGAKSASVRYLDNDQSYEWRSLLIETKDEDQAEKTYGAMKRTVERRLGETASFKETESKDRMIIKEYSGDGVKVSMLTYPLAGKHRVFITILAR